MKSIIAGFTAFLFFIIIFIYGYQNFEHASEMADRTIDLNNQNSKQYSIVKIKDKVLLNIPVTSQFPELARGCEVTSLSMLLNSAGIKSDKMTLAKQIKKDPTPRKIINNNIYYGHPNDGFVGDIYTYSKPGLGVYVQPIIGLANKYLPGKIINLTKSSFDELKIPLSNGQPIWVIINTQYKKLPDSYFTTWHTKKGAIRITSKEHSVLITGYDKNFIYFNDPLTGKKNKKAPINDFKEAWVQMGSQAITYHE
ncbi:C39 family peptidase [Heyndrickxia sporothermodurans]|uniref:C39 family peptidase n=1 Tax=Heyndrickxia sporothermodurans TaxID=46224 RepID=A0AB37HDS1_9BACI|nr:C39 family peptidase [Heyndrickxia sporothermodurans]MBL5768984.1 C39 family peptidase [Heyndrickxia sporothermodurans]MBL5772762.1 C39 family peptidase [Heyndrickxia sporothermodurans]MBL5776243.1 C39 family peptidase [Heyndrickxia sporothermodurans]MBL5779784.1 C39 family peptidase [Heyndrickxia sporothermodurans]MBL5781905.1 C39 family peptidase [Heyndrickxia sporothermodurans]